MALTTYIYSYGWKERQIKHNDDYVLGAKTKKLLDNIGESLELLQVLQEQADDSQAESMDIYFDESSADVFLTVKLFDEHEKTIKVFNVEHGVQKNEFYLLLEFLPFNLEHEINVYIFKGVIADSMNEYTGEVIEIGKYTTKKGIKALR